MIPSLRHRVLLATLTFLSHSPLGYSDQSDFLSLCQVTLAQSAQPASICVKLHQAFFARSPTHPIAPVKPRQVHAPELPIDSKIQFIVFNDPNYLAGMVHCYFSFQGWIDPEKISPDDLGLASSGFSVLSENLEEYEGWLKTHPRGKACRKQVERTSGVPVTDLKRSLKNSKALIGLNPYASVLSQGNDQKAILKDLALTLNHERIHALQFLCPEFEAWGQKQWTKLPESKRAAIRQKYASYNWASLKVAGREYIAYQYEEKPKEILKRLGNCKLN